MFIYDESNCFIKDLLEQEILSCRSGKEFEEKYLGKNFKKPITVYRILDSKKENFKLRKIYENKIKVINVITKPEIEILVIIKENKYADFMKYKSSLKPSQYCKSKLKFHNVKKEKFLENYFHDVDELERVIKEYKRLHKVEDDEKCLADILK